MADTTGLSCTTISPSSYTINKTMSLTHVFIFGSNLDGFHGAGTAGYAMHGSSANVWRSSPIMKAAIEHGPGYKGLRAIYGQAKGYQEGTVGCSYAIATCTKPGARLSIPVRDIQSQAVDLLLFMRSHPEKTFCLTPFGCGYSGHQEADMRPIWNRLLQEANCRWATTTPKSIRDGGTAIDVSHT